jgi:hypothetical protein
MLPLCVFVFRARFDEQFIGVFFHFIGHDGQDLSERLQLQASFSFLLLTDVSILDIFF